LSLMKETLALRETISAWAADPEWSLLCRYDLLRQKPPHSLGDLWFRRAKNMLARLGLVRPHVTKYSWLPTLKHAQPNGDSTILLIWALGVGQDDLRKACAGFLERIDVESSREPVLVTDCADFTYFSRLQWLVEYVPALSGEGPSYRARKLHYLAWRYRDALVVPASAGMACETEWNEVMEMEMKR
jgi:hypothetical protein